MAMAGGCVLVLLMALLSFLRIYTSSLQAQGGQRRPSLFNILRDIPVLRIEGIYVTLKSLREARIGNPD